MTLMVAGVGTTRVTRKPADSIRRRNSLSVLSRPPVTTIMLRSLEASMASNADVPVTITWPDGGPWGKEPIEFRSRVRLNGDDVAPGRYKYVVSAFDAREDPEIEFPMN